ncbi:hypothetical protein [Roseateles amylovorans]|uniref:Uncharacterized protein n=1 Tax=Roseateles amylovorans TaxID=2978473 RepID=A0ABY6AVT7_9BURK|nr:hypothetical protein [Roseateles amylovorans]UXH77291.1 hypothetical protein N4261_20105 [Roseateles amylovorans]
MRTTPGQSVEVEGLRTPMKSKQSLAPPGFFIGLGMKQNACFSLVHSSNVDNVVNTPNQWDAAATDRTFVSFRQLALKNLDNFASVTLTAPNWIGNFPTRTTQVLNQISWKVI